VAQPGLQQLTTPRAAALAGVVFAVLFGAAVVLIRTKMPQDAAELAGWLQDERGAILTATVLMPFAGISFLWFIGAVRDSFGRYEDRFFATVFLGSGMLFLAMMFVALAVAAALVASNESGTDATAHAEVVNFGTLIFQATIQTYGVKMAGVFMMSLATMWRKTGLMPRWLVAVSYVVALAVLIASDASMWVTMAFPVWVLVVSGLILLRAGVFESHRRSNTT
jgi:hypothetical protein